MLYTHTYEEPSALFPEKKCFFDDFYLFVHFMIFIFIAKVILWCKISCLFYATQLIYYAARIHFIRSSMGFKSDD